MPRELEQSEKNVLRINDNLSNSVIELYYRMPTSDEVAKYRNRQTERVRNKLIIRVGETRQRFGAMILTGFKEGDFTHKGVPMASDPASPRYVPDWKEHVKRAAPDLIETLAVHVFDGSNEEIDEDDESSIVNRQSSIDNDLDRD